MPRIQITVFITHVAGWLLFLSLPLVFITNNGNVSVPMVLQSPLYWLCFISFAFVFYLHTYLLIPLLYGQKKVYYFASAALLIAFILWFRPFDRLFTSSDYQQQANGRERMPPDQPASHRLPPGNPPPFQNQPPPGAQPSQHGGSQPPPRQPRSAPVDIISLFMLMVCIAVGFTVATSRRLQEAAARAAKAEADKVSAELSFQKAQINPHFLFNTLNNLYSLALTNSEATADAILKLSNIMRYITDDVHQNMVPLQSEVDCITDFIDLQRLRAGSKLTIDYIVKGDVTTKKLPPLILTTFVENTFKYGVSNHQPCIITISIEADDNGISFLCSNQIFEQKNTVRKGTGIANVQKRLEHLYPNKHSLIIDDTANNIYTVRLVLQD